MWSPLYVCHILERQFKIKCVYMFSKINATHEGGYSTNRLVQTKNVCSQLKKKVSLVLSSTAVSVSFPKYHLLKASSVNVWKQLSSFPVMHRALGRRSYCLLCSQNCKALFSSTEAKPQIKIVSFNLFRLGRRGPSWLKAWSNQSEPIY